MRSEQLNRKESTLDSYSSQPEAFEAACDIEQAADRLQKYLAVVGHLLNEIGFAKREALQMAGVYRIDPIRWEEILRHHAALTGEKT